MSGAAKKRKGYPPLPNWFLKVSSTHKFVTLVSEPITTSSNWTNWVWDQMSYGFVVESQRGRARN